MIYLIDDKYYVNISPNIYVEVNMRLQNDDVILVPTNKQKEFNQTYTIKAICFSQEKDKIKKQLEATEKRNEKNKRNSLVGDMPFKKNKRI